MKFEKLNEDKLRITLNIKDLEEKNIDFHSFVSQSIETQKLFLDMLDEAEQEIGFVTKDYKLMIEALAVNGGEFVLTITRIEKDIEKIKHKKVKIKRQDSKLDLNPLIYSFNNFEDFCSFCNMFNTNSYLKDYKKFIKKDTLYLYNSTYYLGITNIANDYKRIFYSSITEFAEYVKSPEIFDRKLREYGKVIIPKNAITTCIKFFISK